MTPCFLYSVLNLAKNLNIILLVLALIRLIHTLRGGLLSPLQTQVADHIQGLALLQISAGGIFNAGLLSKMPGAPRCVQCRAGYAEERSSRHAREVFRLQRDRVPNRQGGVTFVPTY